MMLRGTIVAVTRRVAAGELAGAHASGSSTLTVTDAFDFNADGGSISIEGQTYTYTKADTETDTLTLSGTTAADHEDGDKVTILPAREEKIATVVLDGDDDAIPARIMHVLQPYLAEGVREPGDQEYAVLLSDGEEYLVIDAPGKVPAIDAAAIVPEPETVMIDGPPDYWCLEPFGDSDLLTYAEMEAVADPVWVAAIADVVAVDGTIAVPTKVLASDVSPKYYPVWLVALEGRQCRVAMDDVTFVSGSEIGQVRFGASLQNASLDYGQGYTDQFQFLYEDADTQDKRWFGYTTLYPDSAPGDFIQTDPLQSLTQQESASISWGGYDTDPGMPYMAVSLWHPLANWATTADANDLEITGLRVELL